MLSYASLSIHKRREHSSHCTPTSATPFRSKNNSNNNGTSNVIQAIRQECTSFVRHWVTKIDLWTYILHSLYFNKWKKKNNVKMIEENTIRVCATYTPNEWNVNYWERKKRSISASATHTHSLICLSLPLLCICSSWTLKNINLRSKHSHDFLFSISSSFSLLPTTL